MKYRQPCTWHIYRQPCALHISWLPARTPALGGGGSLCLVRGDTKCFQGGEYSPPRGGYITTVYRVSVNCNLRQFWRDPTTWTPCRAECWPCVAHLSNVSTRCRRGLTVTALCRLSVCAFRLILNIYIIFGPRCDLGSGAQRCPRGGTPVVYPP